MPRTGTDTASRFSAGMAAGIPAALYAAAAGLVVIESSDHSVLFRFVLDIDFRLPVAAAILAGAGFAAGIARRLDKDHRLTRDLAADNGSVTGPAAGRLEWFAIAACLSAHAILLTHSFGPPIDRTLTDPFHEGEYLGASAIFGNAAEIPVLIHGPGRNLLPAALASLFAESGREIAFMRFVTELGAMGTIVMVALATYVLSLAMLGESATRSRRQMIASVLSLGAVSAAILLAHASNRHVLFLAAIALAGGIIAAANRDRWRLHVLCACLGAICAIAPIHVYSTGLQTLAISAVAAGILLARDGRSSLRWIATALIAFAACIALIGALGGGRFYSNALRDIWWWGIEARGIWALPLHGVRSIALTVFSAAVIGLAGYLACTRMRAPDTAARRRAALYALLSAAVLIASRDMWERSDLPHVEYTLLTTLVAFGAVAAVPTMALYGRWPRLVGAGAAAVAILAGTAGLLSGDSVPRMLDRADTADESILPDDLLAFARRYEADRTDADCLLVMTNEGVLNHVLALPPCGPFFYPIYAGVPDGDRAMANWLRANPQSLAVVGTEFWSGRIDGRPMNYRLPEVWRLIEATMPSRETVVGRTVASSP